MKIFFIFILAFSINEKIISQTLVHPNIPSDMITDLHYLNDLEIIFINAGGSIYKSYDGGINWELKKSYQNNYLAQIKFIDNDLGFIRPENYISGDNSIIYTNDGGETWDRHPVSIFPVNSFLPLSQSLMLKATIEGIQRLDNFFDLWETTFQVPTFADSGEDFIEIIPFGSIIKLNKMNNGMLTALGRNENAYNHGIMDDSISYILKSEDSGLNWDTLWIGLDQIIKDIVFINDSIGWMISDTSLFKSTNGGFSWSIQNAYFDGNYYKDLFAKGNHLYLLTGFNKFIKSTNSGSFWSYIDLNFINLLSMNFFDDSNGFLFGESLLRTTNSGENWEDLNQYARNDIYDLDFISKAEGIAFGNKGVYKTYDGGSSWTLKFLPEDLLYNNPGSLEMLNDSSGLLMASGIFKTNDGGENWKSIVLDEQRHIFNSMTFSNESLGVITASTESNPGSHVFDLNSSYITTDGGESWTKKHRDPIFFNKLKFTDPSHLWGISQSGMWVSYDTATTWRKIYGGDYFIGSWSFDFYDSLYGVVTCSYGQAYLTTDGGHSWKTFNKPIGNHPTDCKIIGPYIFGSQRILETGSDGKFMITYIYPNGEIDFDYQMPSYTKETLNTIEVFVENDFPYVWVAGNGFTILYRQFEKIPLEVNSENNSIYTFSLFQNYPNPFNPNTTICYQIPQREFVSLKIYNLMGEEIKTLVNEEQSAGTYNIKFNGGNLSSGIYFYTLKSGNFIKTKKFILLK
jgi:photosystem II stability/assembly factor-like uncharacterized protein